MAKYRIVKKKHTLDSYMVQKKLLGLFWYTIVGDILHFDLRDCEWFVERNIQQAKIAKDNPRDIVVKTY